MTTPLVGDLVSTLVGLVVLTLGADLLVRGASALASRAGIPPLLVGLTVVALGTSAPEIAVSLDAAMGGRGDVALGNVVGSNIFNVLFILGASALAAPLVVKSQLVRLDVPVMVAVSALPLLMGLDGAISRGDGGLLLVLMAAYVAVLALLARRGEGHDAIDVDAVATPSSSPLLDLAFALGGLVLLVLGADALVEGATALARAAGVSELVVGLTVVAAGTSLPELATSLVASLRGQRDLAVGNVVGSNIFNVLAVLGTGAAVSGGLEVAPGLLRFDFPVMLAVGLACLPVFMTGAAITRVEGAVFLAYYLIYAIYLGLHTADHPFQEEFGIAVLGVVLPLTIAVAAAMWLRGPEDETVGGAG
ncbi:calcium/sodium antiporter [Gemmatimonadota bacterium Y43]|uniref:calcium/sodium antiporter n=1 Tax=Gaopeijia maritima TaxID=3119007 RepID=UPI00326BE718